MRVVYRDRFSFTSEEDASDVDRAPRAADSVPTPLSVTNSAGARDEASA
jgi:hypothetical protein